MACPPHTPRWSARLTGILRDWGVPIAELTIRLAAIFLGTDLLLSLPLPLEGTCLTLVQALIVLGAVALVGITLLESLFYNRYHP
jgi:hypothetical protein